MIKYLLLSLVTINCIAQQNGKKLVWQEDFNSKVLDEKVWNYDLGDGCPSICGWGNNEKQVYTKNNHLLQDGNLIITANKVGETYTSTRLTTANKKEFLYGTMEI